MHASIRQEVIVTLLNVACKILGFALVLSAANLAVPGLYPSYMPIVLTIAMLTAVGAAADLIIVPKLGNFPALLLGLPAITGIIWLVARAWPPSHLSLGWAILLAFLIGPIEYVLHRFVLESLT